MISQLFKALQAGQQLPNSTTWKGMQITTGIITAIFGTVVFVLSCFGIKVDIDFDQMMVVASGIVALLGLFNSYSTVATTKTIGTKPPDET